MIQRFPHILIVHLKRFDTGTSYGKLQTSVNCPLTELDLSKYSSSPDSSPLVYNLYAVSNHSGTMLSGHYTAYAKHPFSGQWHAFNDSRVSDHKLMKLNSSEAYLLFYEHATEPQQQITS
jgi:ubiquitin carboxyl-terminal hydrolase 2/21